MSPDEPIEEQLIREAAADPKAHSNGPSLEELIAGKGLGHKQSWHWERPDPLGALYNQIPLSLVVRDQVGLDVGSRWVKYALVRRSFGKTRLLAAGGVPILMRSKGQMARIRAQVGALLTVRERIPRRHERWIVGISGPGTMVRTVEVPRMPRKELLHAIKWQAQKKFPFSLDDAHVAISTTRTGPKQPVRAVVSAALKRMVDDFLYLLSEAEIRPSALTLPAFGLSAALGMCPDEETESFRGVIDLGGERSLLAVYDGPHLEFFRELDIGLNDIVETLMADETLRGRLGVVTAEQMSALLFGGGVPAPADLADAPDLGAQAVVNALDRLVLELQSTLEYYAGQVGGLKISKFRILGGGSNIPGIGPHLRRALELPVEAMAPDLGMRDKIEEGEMGSPAKWASAFGYALSPRRVPNLLPPDYLAKQEEELRTVIWRTTTGTAVAVSLLLAGAEFYLADYASRRLAKIETQMSVTSAQIEQIGAHDIESMLAANRKWMLSVQQPDLNSARLLRAVAALTPEAVVIDRVDVRGIDSAGAVIGVYGEVRTEHAQNEVVLAAYIQSLKDSGVFSEVALTAHNTRRETDYEHIIFSAQMRMGLEVTR